MLFIRLGTNFFCINPKCKSFKIEHVSYKSSPNPRNTQRTSFVQIQDVKASTLNTFNFPPNPAQTQGIHKEHLIFQWFGGFPWNIHCSKQIPHLLTAVYSLDTLTLGNQYIFTHSICSSRWALGINFFCIHPIGKNYKIEHFSSKSRPNPRNAQRTSDFPMVWWFPLKYPLQ